MQVRVTPCRLGRTWLQSVAVDPNPGTTRTVTAPAPSQCSHCRTPSAANTRATSRVGRGATRTTGRAVARVAEGAALGEALGDAESVAAGAELDAAARVGVDVAPGELPELHAETVVRTSPRPIPVTTN